MNTEKRLQRINNAYDGSGDKELALFFTDRWVLYVGNPSMHVRLGEVEGEHCFEGFNLEDVLIAAEDELLSNVEDERGTAVAHSDLLEGLGSDD